MRYILDNNGYIEELIFADGAVIECNNKTCTEYTGTVPDGFSSLDDWAMNSNVRAYHIVDGNLSFDPVRLMELETVATEEDAMYRPATMGDLYKAVSVYTDNAQQSYSQYATGKNLVEMEGSGGFAIPQFVISKYQEPNTWGYLKKFTWEELSSYTWEEAKKVRLKTWAEDTETWNEDTTNWNTLEAHIPLQYLPEKLEIVTSTKNLLPIEFDKYLQEGLTITKEYDGGLSIKGTTAEDKEIVLCGNTDMIFYLNALDKLCISGLGDCEIKLYDVDSTGGTLIYQGGNGTISYSQDYRVSKISIVIPSGTYNTTIYPQIEFGDSATEFEINKRDYLSMNTNNNTKLTLLNGELRLDGVLIDYSNSLRSYKWFMVNALVTSTVQYVLSETDGDITRVRIKADQIDLAGYTTIVNHDEYSNTKVEFLPNNDLEAVMKVSVQHLIDGEDAPFIQKFTIDKTGEVHLKGTLYIDSGAMDAIEITDASGTGYINSTGFHTS